MSQSEARPSIPISPEGPEPPHGPGAPSPGIASVRPRRSWWRNLLLLLMALAGGGGLLWWWLARHGEVFTDNAYVVGNITPISSEITGQVVALFIDDNMIVRPGDPIAQIDPVAFQIQVDQALADYQQTSADAQAAAVTADYTDQDRKSLLVGAQARQDESEQAANASGEAVQTQKRLLEKDEHVLASLYNELPRLIALRDNAKDYFDRFNSLAKSGDIPVQDRDNRETAYRDAQARLDSLRSRIAAADRQVQAGKSLLEETQIRLVQSRKALANAAASVGRARAEQLQPKVATNTATALRHRQMLAEARLRLAKLNLSNTLIRAPQAGIISRRTIQLGQTVEAHKPFLSIVPLDPDNVWVIANLREEQMARVRVGQPAVILVDGVPGRTFAGWVESVAGGTGSVFSLFPPDNATGNFVRVVQRLPVRVRFRPEEYEKRIRPGMSARITIDTIHYVRSGTQEW